MREFNEFVKKHKLTPETKRVLSLFLASAVAEAYVDFLPKYGISMSGVSIVKEGEYITFYLDVSRVIQEIDDIFKKTTVESFLKKHKSMCEESLKEINKGNWDYLVNYFASMGAVKALTRYINNTGRFKEYHDMIGSVFNEIAEYYSKIDSTISESQKNLTLNELRNNIKPKKREECTITYDGKTWKEYDSVPKIHVKDISSLKGNGFGGKIIKGKVSHIPKEGFIFVTTMTNPHHTPILKKVKAIVTDEGGILSHAAVIAREFNIPCVVGTKIATKVLKDGDLVEVDTVKGIIKKIKRG